MSMEPYVIAIGSACVDEYYRVESWIPEGGKTTAQPLKCVVGGMIANAASVMSRCGLKTYLLDTMNHSGTTKLILEDMVRYGVDCSLIQYDETLGDGKCLIFLTESEKSLFSVRLHKPELDLSPIWNMLCGARYIYTKFDDFVRVKDYIDVMAELRRSGTGLVLDVEAYSGAECEYAMLTNAEIVFLNQFGEEACKKQLGENFAEKLLEGNARTVIVTEGSRGCRVCTKEGRAQVPAYSVPITDTTGAGDTFNGACLSRLCAGQSEEEAARFAAAAAALCVEHYGAKFEELDTAMVESFMLTAGGR